MPRGAIALGVLGLESMAASTAAETLADSGSGRGRALPLPLPLPLPRGPGLSAPELATDIGDWPWSGDARCIRFAGDGSGDGVCERRVLARACSVSGPSGWRAWPLARLATGRSSLLGDPGPSESSPSSPRASRPRPSNGVNMDTELVSSSGPALSGSALSRPSAGPGLGGGGGASCALVSTRIRSKISSSVLAPAGKLKDIAMQFRKKMIATVRRKCFL